MVLNLSLLFCVHLQRLSALLRALLFFFFFFKLTHVHTPTHGQPDRLSSEYCNGAQPHAKTSAHSTVASHPTGGRRSPALRTAKEPGFQPSFLKLYWTWDVHNMPQLQGERAEVLISETEHQGHYLRTFNPIIQQAAAQNADSGGNAGLSISRS